MAPGADEREGALQNFQRQKFDGRGQGVASEFFRNSSFPKNAALVYLKCRPPQSGAPISLRHWPEAAAARPCSRQVVYRLV